MWSRQRCGAGIRVAAPQVSAGVELVVCMKELCRPNMSSTGVLERLLVSPGVHADYSHFSMHIQTGASRSLSLGALPSSDSSVKGSLAVFGVEWPVHQVSGGAIHGASAVVPEVVEQQMCKEKVGF